MTRVDNAIILAAGLSSRFAPLSYENPKGLTLIKGENMIERQIKQLHEKNIFEIYIVVGYRYKQFEYLKEKYGVKLIYNDMYSSWNNIYSLYLCRDVLKNTYILSSDNYMTENIFSEYESKSWYSAVNRKKEEEEWFLKYDENDRITGIEIGIKKGFYMYGPVFLNKVNSDKMKKYLEEYTNNGENYGELWEKILKDNLKDFEIYINRKSADIVYEFESLEELRVFDSSYLYDSKNKIMKYISDSFNIKEHEIYDIRPMKTGMTNKSFTFRIDGNQYICRVPGEGTELFIDREKEYEVYNAIRKLNISDIICFYDKKTYIKITEYIEGSKLLDVNSSNELIQALKLLKKLHSSNIKVDYDWDLSVEVMKYLNLCIKAEIKIDKLEENLIKINELINDIRLFNFEKKLIHGDPLHENFLVSKNKVYLIDWEYSGMGDPLVDLAMMALCEDFTNKEIEYIYYVYNDERISNEILAKIYSYIALGGFTWYLWSKLKEKEGVDLGEYKGYMYRKYIIYFKKYIDIKNKI